MAQAIQAMNNPLHPTLPEHVTEHAFCEGRKFRFDYAWPVQKVALEVEGGIWSKGHHARPKGILRDIEKGNIALAFGWRVARCTPQTLTSPEIISLLRTLILYNNP